MQEHFQKDQFIDFEKKKLKKDAIPTIFSFNDKHKIVQRKKPTINRPPKIIRIESFDCDKNKAVDVSENNNDSNETFSIRKIDNDVNKNNCTIVGNGISKIFADVNIQDDASKNKYDLMKTYGIRKADNSSNKISSSTKADGISTTVVGELGKLDDVSKDLIIASLHKKLEESNKMVVKLQEKNFHLKVKLKRETLRSASLRFQAKKLRDEKKISFFGDDQNQALKRKSMAYAKWSDETIKKAVELKSACGIAGYECILRFGFPFPSISTLDRRLKTNFAASDVEDDKSNDYVTSELEYDELNGHVASVLENDVLEYNVSNDIVNSEE